MPGSNPAWDEAYAAALKKSSSAQAQQKAPQPKARITDIELPNESGVIDPRLTTAKEKLSLDALTKRVDAIMGKK